MPLFKTGVKIKMKGFFDSFDMPVLLLESKIGKHNHLSPHCCFAFIRLHVDVRAGLLDNDALGKVHFKGSIC